MRWLPAIAVVLALGCGGGLEGRPAAAPVGDWSFVREADAFAIASGDGTPLRFVLADPVVHEGRLYLRLMTIFKAEDAALDQILSEGRVQVVVDGTLHSGRAVRLNTALEIDPLLPEILRLGHMQATRPRWNPSPAKYPGTQVRQWIFRFEPDRTPARP